MSDICYKAYLILDFPDPTSDPTASCAVAMGPESFPRGVRRRYTLPSPMSIRPWSRMHKLINSWGQEYGSYPTIGQRHCWLRVKVATVKVDCPTIDQRHCWLRKVNNHEAWLNLIDSILKDVRRSFADSALKYGVKRGQSSEWSSTEQDTTIYKE